MIGFGIDVLVMQLIHHLLLSVSVYTLGQTVRLNSHSLVDCLFPCLIWDLGSHSHIALSMPDRFWYWSLGDATHLLRGASFCTLGQKVGLNSNSPVSWLFACLIWDSGSHSLIPLSMHDRFWYRCLGDATHLLLGVSVCTLGQKVGLNSNSPVSWLFACLIWDSGSHSLFALSMHHRFWWCNSLAPWCISLNIGTKSKT